MLGFVVCINIMLILVLLLNETNDKMKTVSDIRTEKRVKEVQSELVNQKLIQERIKYCISESDKEKQSIQDCLNNCFFDMATQKIERIKELKQRELSLRSKLS